MRKIHAGLIIAIAASVFVICFMMGRATALKEKDEEKNKIIYNGVVPVPRSEEKSIETSQKTEKVPYKETENKSAEELVQIPQRMIFPCGENVQKPYSQMAIYSETMGDWRAHTGIDYSADIGTDVKAVQKGKVSRVYEDKLWGYTVEISHSAGVKSVYKNLDENIEVSNGQSVTAGQVVGYVGNSADIESLEEPHLHFEMYSEGITVNPESYIY